MCKKLYDARAFMCFTVKAQSEIVVVHVSFSSVRDFVFLTTVKHRFAVGRLAAAATFARRRLRRPSRRRQRRRLWLVGCRAAMPVLWFCLLLDAVAWPLPSS